jgi:hypothetical protein
VAVLPYFTNVSNRAAVLERLYDNSTPNHRCANSEVIQNRNAEGGVNRYSPQLVVTVGASSDMGYS